MFEEKLEDLTQLTKLADELSDGHYTIMKFTTGYKVLLKTPDLTLEGREDLSGMQIHKFLDEAISDCIVGKVNELVEDELEFVSVCRVCGEVIKGAVVTDKEHSYHLSCYLDMK